MYSELYKLITKPEFKQGLILAPAFSGRTTALCAKAVISSVEGGYVLLVAKDQGQLFGEGGVKQKIESYCRENNLKVRYSEESSTLTINKNSTKLIEGRVKLADLNYIPTEFKPTLTIFLDGTMEDLDLYGCCHSDTIFCSSHYDFIKINKRSNFVTSIRNVKGEVVDYKLQALSYFNEDGDIQAGIVQSLGTTNYSYNPAGYFYIEVKERSNCISMLNPVFVKYLDNLNYIDKVKKCSTSFSECLKLINAGHDDYQIIGTTKDFGDGVYAVLLPQDCFESPDVTEVHTKMYKIKVPTDVMSRAFDLEGRYPSDATFLDAMISQAAKLESGEQCYFLVPSDEGWDIELIK